MEQEKIIFLTKMFARGAELIDEYEFISDYHRTYTDNKSLFVSYKKYPLNSMESLRVLSLNNITFGHETIISIMYPWYLSWQYIYGMPVVFAENAESTFELLNSDKIIIYNAGPLIQRHVPQDYEKLISIV